MCFAPAVVIRPVLFFNRDQRANECPNSFARWSYTSRIT